MTNAAIRRDRGWIADISTCFAPDTKILQLLDEYCNANPGFDRDNVYERMEGLRGIRNNSLGLIELNAELDVETVADIFVRVNSQGVTLNEADFAMSKMAASEQYGGHLLRSASTTFAIWRSRQKITAIWLRIMTSHLQNTFVQWSG